MLDLSRIDAGLPLHLHDVDLAAVLDAEADRAAMLAPQVTVARTGLTALNIEADPTRLAQILSNLLDNARRYTPPGGTSRRSGSKRRRRRGGYHQHRPGIPETSVSVSSSGSCRLDAGRARDHGGAGLGWRSPGRWRAPTAASSRVCRTRGAPDSGSVCPRRAWLISSVPVAKSRRDRVNETASRVTATCG